MAWIQQILFIIVMTTSKSKCKNDFSYTLSEDFPQYDYDYTDYSPMLRPPTQPSRNSPRMIGRSAEGTNERPNERSFSAHSGTQRVQEQERKRIESRIAEPVTRNDNGSYKILNYPSLASRRGGTDASSVKDRIVFPGPTSAKYQKQDIPEQCFKMGICDNVPNYPKEIVARVLAENADLRSRFQIDQLDIPEIPDIAQRVGPSEDETELCYFEMKVYYPKGAVDKNGNFLYILNDDDNPLQGVKVEICDLERNNGSCKGLATFPLGYTSKCNQKHVSRKLWAIENNKVVERFFSIPSCCSCVVKSTIGPVF